MYFDTLYNKEPKITHEKNPGFKARNSLDFIHFEIVRPSGVKNIKLVIHKKHSLWDLYEKSYFAVYPHIPREHFQPKNTLHIPSNLELNPVFHDAIPPADVPVITGIFIHNEKTNELKTIPVHRFIKISDYVKCNQQFFGNKKCFKIYVVDEAVINHQQHKENSANLLQSLQKYVSCKLFSGGGTVVP
jgi:hypothetical protein